LSITSRPWRQATRSGRRTKPRALNAALPLARGALLTVYDAEDAPDPGQLRGEGAGEPGIAGIVDHQPPLETGDAVGQAREQGGCSTC
jgi:hypothetical protein